MDKRDLAGFNATKSKGKIPVKQLKSFYEKFGFKVYGVMEKNFPLKQYCLIREVQ